MNADILSESIQIGNVELKNRIAMSPMDMGHALERSIARAAPYVWLTFPHGLVYPEGNTAGGNGVQ